MKARKTRGIQDYMPRQTTSLVNTLSFYLLIGLVMCQWKKRNELFNY